MRLDPIRPLLAAGVTAALVTTTSIALLMTARPPQPAVVSCTVATHCTAPDLSPRYLPPGTPRVSD